MATIQNIPTKDEKKTLDPIGGRTLETGTGQAIATGQGAEGQGLGPMAQLRPPTKKLGDETGVGEITPKQDAIVGPTEDFTTEEPLLDSDGNPLRTLDPYNPDDTLTPTPANGDPPPALDEGKVDWNILNKAIKHVNRVHELGPGGAAEEVAWKMLPTSVQNHIQVIKENNPALSTFTGFALQLAKDLVTSTGDVLTSDIPSELMGQFGGASEIPEEAINPATGAVDWTHESMQQPKPFMPKTLDAVTKRIPYLNITMAEMITGGVTQMWLEKLAKNAIYPKRIQIGISAVGTALSVAAAERLASIYQDIPVEEMAARSVEAILNEFVGISAIGAASLRINKKQLERAMDTARHTPEQIKNRNLISRWFKKRIGKLSRQEQYRGGPTAAEDVDPDYSTTLLNLTNWLSGNAGAYRIVEKRKKEQVKELFRVAKDMIADVGRVTTPEEFGLLIADGPRGKMQWAAGIYEVWINEYLEKAGKIKVKIKPIADALQKYETQVAINDGDAARSMALTIRESLGMPADAARAQQKHLDTRVKGDFYAADEVTVENLMTLIQSLKTYTRHRQYSPAVKAAEEAVRVTTKQMKNATDLVDPELARTFSNANRLYYEASDKWNRGILGELVQTAYKKVVETSGKGKGMATVHKPNYPENVFKGMFKKGITGVREIMEDMKWHLVPVEKSKTHPTGIALVRDPSEFNLTLFKNAYWRHLYEQGLGAVDQTYSFRKLNSGAWSAAAFGKTHLTPKASYLPGMEENAAITREILGPKHTKLMEFLIDRSRDIEARPIGSLLETASQFQNASTVKQIFKGLGLAAPASVGILGSMLTLSPTMFVGGVSMTLGGLIMYNMPRLIATIIYTPGGEALLRRSFKVGWRTRQGAAMLNRMFGLANVVDLGIREKLNDPSYTDNAVELHNREISEAQQQRPQDAGLGAQITRKGDIYNRVRASIRETGTVSPELEAEARSIGLDPFLGLVQTSEGLMEID